MIKDKKTGCRVLLVTPPRGLWKDEVERPWISTQPLGLAYIAAALRDAGYPVEVIDAYSLGLPGSHIREKTEQFRPQVVGISALTPQWPDAEKVADIVKAVDGDILTVTGGPHVTALPEQAAAYPGVDVAVLGEGEKTMLDICQTIVDGSDLRQVAGIVVKNNSSTRATRHRERLTDLDSLSFPAHDLLPKPDMYNPFPAWGKSGNFSCLISGRGCPYKCAFCDVTAQQGFKYRLRSAENVVDEMTWLNRDFGVTTFSFRDPSMVCNRRRLLEICRLIGERNLDIAWTCSGRANEVDPEMLVAMRGAGCRLVQYGIEVGNAEMLKSIKKLSKERVAQAVRETRQAGVQAHGYFMFGFMEETPETIEETIAFSQELDLDSAGFAVMVPFPGTPEYDMFKNEGLLLTEVWSDYDVMGKPVYHHKNISEAQLLKAPRRAYRGFYLRPHIISRHLRKMASPRVLRNYLHSSRKMMFG